MKEVDIEKLNEAQIAAAAALGEGPILFAYMDEQTLHMETVDGDDPFRWEDGKWVRMLS